MWQYDEEHSEECGCWLCGDREPDAQYVPVPRIIDIDEYNMEVLDKFWDTWYDLSFGGG